MFVCFLAFFWYFWTALGNVRFFGVLRKYDNIFRFLFLLFDSRNLAETDCCLKVCSAVERVGGRVLKTDSSAVFKPKERIYAKNFSPIEAIIFFAKLRFVSNAGDKVSPSEKTIDILFVSAAKPASAAETSFATTASRFFARIFPRAYSSTFWVSAAKPTKIREPLFLESVRRISGVRSSSGFRSIPSFFTFSGAHCFGRTSLTAADIIRISQFSNSSKHASSISCADTTRRVFMFSGLSSGDAPRISVVCQPASRAASATATPIFPVDGLLMKRTGSKCSRVAPAVTRHLIFFIGRILSKAEVFAIFFS